MAAVNSKPSRPDVRKEACITRRLLNVALFCLQLLGRMTPVQTAAEVGVSFQLSDFVLCFRSGKFMVWGKGPEGVGGGGVFVYEQCRFFV